jgi:nitroreductase
MDRHRTLADVESGLRMPLTDAMETQRAIRRLLPDPVDDAIVLRCVELALKAPTGSNAQNWEWVLVKDRKAKETLATRYREAWLLYGIAARVASKRDRRARRMVDAVQWQVDHFAEVPVLVVACLRGGRPPLIPLPSVAESSFYGSIYPAVQNLLLAARAMGLGAALVTMPLWNVISVRRALGLPVSVTPCCVIPMGWPRGRYGPTTRKPVGDVVHLDHFGNRPWRSTGGARHPDTD